MTKTRTTSQVYRITRRGGRTMGLAWADEQSKQHVGVCRYNDGGVRVEFGIFAGRREEAHTYVVTLSPALINRIKELCHD